MPTVTVYDVVEAGVTVMADVVAPVFHEYVVPPDAVSVVLLPAHIDVVPEILGVGEGLTVMVTLVLSEHEPLLTTTVYVVVDAGLAVTVALVVLLKPVAGFHVYVLPPDAVNTVEPPLHIVVVPETDAVTEPPTVTVTVVESLQPAALVPTTV